MNGLHDGGLGHETEWSKIDAVFNPYLDSGIIWITCDRFALRAQLVDAFAARYAQYAHAKSSASGYDWLADFELDAFLGTCFDLEVSATDKRPGILHLTVLEQYLPTVEDEYRSGDFANAMAREWEQLLQMGKPIVCWSNTYCKSMYHEAIPELDKKLSAAFHFEGSPLPQDHSALPPAKFISYHRSPTADEIDKERIKISNLEAQAAISMRPMNILEELGNKYRNLGEFAQEQRCRMRAIKESQHATLDRQANCWELLACSYLLSKDLPSATKSFETATALQYLHIHGQEGRKPLPMMYILDLSAHADGVVAFVYCGENGQLQTSIHYENGYADPRGGCLIELAEELLEIQRAEDAVKIFKRGIVTALVDFEREDAAEGFVRLAQLFLQMDRVEEAARLMVEIYQIESEYNRTVSKMVLSRMQEVLALLSPSRQYEIKMELHDRGAQLDQ